MQFKPARNNELRVRYYDFSRVFVEDFQFPRWWTERWGWTAFIHRTDFLGAHGLFYPLGERIVLQQKKLMWQLSDVLQGRLFTLEMEIITAVHRLAALTQSAIIYPPPPRAFGYRKAYKSSENARACAEHSRKWFLVWLGLFSYLIAVAETKECSLRVYPNLRIAMWTMHLLDNSFHPTWIDDILSSPVCLFDPHYHRAGVFIQFRRGQSNQPSADWYCKYGVPVWYELSKDSPIIAIMLLPEMCAPPTTVVGLNAIQTGMDAGESVNNCYVGGPHHHTNSDSDHEMRLEEALKDAGNHSSGLPANHSSISRGSHFLSDLATESLQETIVDLPVDVDSEWKAFFGARDAQNASLIAKETQLQKQKRLSREKTPATTSAKVFEWTPDNLGIYRRQAVSGRYKLDTLEGYTKNQTRYDAIRNEWDCCVAFAPNDVSDDDDDDEMGFDMYTTPRKTSMNANGTSLLQDRSDRPVESSPTEAVPPLHNGVQPEDLECLVNTCDALHAIRDESRSECHDDNLEPETPVNVDDPLYTLPNEILSESLVQNPDVLQSVWHPTPLDDAADWIPAMLPMILDTSSSQARRDEILEEEILRTGYLMYGFAPQGAAEHQHVPALCDQKQKKALMQILGFRWHADHEKALETARISYFSDFLDRLGVKKSIPHLDWDLGEAHINSVALLSRFSTIRIVDVHPGDAKLYMFEGDNKSPVKWNLAMTTAAHAIMVCRLDQTWDIVHIARYLVWKGIPFNTLVRSNSVPRAPLVSTDHLPRHPLRPTGYQFTTDDYQSYRHRCDQILNMCRGHVALMMGGHLWRLATSIVSFDDALRGPSGWYTELSKMLIATDPRTGNEYIDDQFTEDEIESLCGMNLYLTGSKYFLLYEYLRN